MDYFQDYILRQVPFYDSLSPYIGQIQSQFSTPSSSASRASSSSGSSSLDSLLSLFQDSNPLLAVGIVVASAFVSLKVLGYVRSWISFFVGLLFQLLFWMLAVAAGLYVYNRGLERCAAELWAWGREVVEFWWRSYEEHSGAAAAGVRGGRGGAGSGSGGRSGAGYRNR